MRRLYSRTVDKGTGLRSDQTVVLSVQKSSKDYPEKLRSVVYFDEETGKRLIFLTKNYFENSNLFLAGPLWQTCPGCPRGRSPPKGGTPTKTVIS